MQYRQYPYSFTTKILSNYVVGTFSTTDPETGDTFTYQLVAGAGDTDNAAFTIVGDKLQINSSPDFETQSSYSIRVQTTDPSGESYSENLTININDVNEDTTLKITPSEPTKAVEPNTSVSFDVNYSTEPAETPTTGIAFGMHWDSSQVAFDPVTGLTEHFSLGAQPISAVLDDPVTNGGSDFENEGWAIPEPEPLVPDAQPDEAEGIVDDVVLPEHHHLVGGYGGYGDTLTPWNYNSWDPAREIKRGKEKEEQLNPQLRAKLDAANQYGVTHPGIYHLTDQTRLGIYSSFPWDSHGIPKTSVMLL